MTLPPEQLRHYISDDELEVLGNMRKEPVMEIFLASIGVFFGSLVPACAGLNKVGDTADPIMLSDMLSIVLAVGALGIMLVTGFLWRQRYKTSTNMVDNIRCRPKIPVRLAHGNGN